MSRSPERDQIYAASRSEPTGFTFDERVADVFPDMIRRSVPGYAAVIGMTGVLAAEYAQPHSHCYDLGCSLGATALSIQQGIQTEGCRIIAVDNSAAMLEQAKQYIEPSRNEIPIELVCADIQDIEIRDASLVTLNFTLQFIPVEQRVSLLQKIYHGLRPQGILILSEKITFDDPEEERLQMEMHHAFKRANGYNDLEISRKRSALENVLIPETLVAHKQRLDAAGFSRADLWFQCFNFVSLVARK
ncbi:MAG: carboxy-S-adenosyl-L-methionine synthase CmoA [Candidatus Sedimenticola sp. (ex Thyasira tokunagai)]